MEVQERPAPKHGNPFSRDPARSKHTGEVHRITPKRLNANQLRTLALCYEYRASIPFIAADTGCSLKMASDRTRMMKRPPNDYIAIFDVTRETYGPEHIAVQQYFTATDRGKAVLINRGYCDICMKAHEGTEMHNPLLPLVYPRSNSFKHDVFSHNGMMSLEMGIKSNPTISLIKGAELHSQLPAKAKELEHWWKFPLIGRGQGERVEPDYFPTGIDRDPNQEPLFLVFEFERGTHDARRRLYKVKDWLDVLKHQTYKKHLGLPNLYPTFVTEQITDKDIYRNLIREHVPREFQKYFLAKAQPLGATNTGWMLETDFETAYGTFNLISTKQ